MADEKGFFTIAAWQKADDLAVKIYQITNVETSDFPKHQLFSLIQQFQKAAVSVAANIAEGSGRSTLKEYIHFLYIARGFLREVEYYTHLCRRLGYLSDEIHRQLNELVDATAKTLTGFIRFKASQLQQQQRA